MLEAVLVAVLVISVILFLAALKFEGWAVEMVVIASIYFMLLAFGIDRSFKWVIAGGACLVVMTIGYLSHVYYVVRYQWLVQYAFSKSQRTLPRPGVATIRGIVSAIGDDPPIQVIMREELKSGGENAIWEETSRKVKATMFTVLLPEVGARVIVEPGDRVLLRSEAHTTDEKSLKRGRIGRYRKAVVDDGDQVIITGMLSEERSVELERNQYRSAKENVRIEYTLRPLPDQGLRVDSKTLVDEVRRRINLIGWVRGISIILLFPVYLEAVADKFSNESTGKFVGVLSLYVFGRLMTMAQHERRPWFLRPLDGKKRYRFREHVSATFADD